MASSLGNRHVVKESEAEDMKRRGVWGSWLSCLNTLAELNPAAGPFEVRVVVLNDDREDLTYRVDDPPREVTA